MSGRESGHFLRALVVVLAPASQCLRYEVRAPELRPGDVRAPRDRGSSPAHAIALNGSGIVLTTIIFPFNIFLLAILFRGISWLTFRNTRFLSVFSDFALLSPSCSQGLGTGPAVHPFPVSFIVTTCDYELVPQHSDTCHGKLIWGSVSSICLQSAV